MWQFLSLYEVVTHHGLHDGIMLEDLEYIWREETRGRKAARFLKAFRRMVQPLEVHGFVHQFRIFLHSDSYRLSETRRNVEHAWPNGMVVILFILGVCTWRLYITKDGRHDDLWRGFCEVSFFKVFLTFPFLPLMATSDPGLGAVLCLFVRHTFLSACALRVAIWIFRNISC